MSPGLKAAALLLWVVSPALVGACGNGADQVPATSAETRGAPGESADNSQRFPDVIEATAVRDGDIFSFEVTISSPYDSAARYADGWRILGPNGEVYAEHGLAHDHAGEQPFTRTQRGVEIPAGVTEVVVEARDLVNGYGGGTVMIELPTVSATTAP